MAQMRNAAGFAALLKELKACPEAYKWAHGKTLHRVWKTCDRADWLLWLCDKMVGQPGWPTRKELVLAACACAETSLKYVKAGEDSPRKAIETAHAWVRGEVSIEDVGRAAYAAYAAVRATRRRLRRLRRLRRQRRHLRRLRRLRRPPPPRRLRRRLRRRLAAPTPPTPPPTPPPRQGARRNGGNRPRNNQGTRGGGGGGGGGGDSGVRW